RPHGRRDCVSNPLSATGPAPVQTTRDRARLAGPARLYPDRLAHRELVGRHDGRPGHRALEALKPRGRSGELESRPRLARPAGEGGQWLARPSPSPPPLSPRPRPARPAGEGGEG